MELASYGLPDLDKYTATKSGPDKTFVGSYEARQVDALESIAESLKQIAERLTPPPSTERI